MTATLVAADASARLDGEVEFEQVSSLKAEGVRLCENADKALEFDLSGVTQANSVTVALMLAWARCGAEQGIEVTFSGAAEPLRKIVQFSGLSELLRLR